MRIYTPSSNYITITRKEMEIADNSRRCFYPTLNMMYNCIYLFNDDMANGYLELSEEVCKLISEGKTRGNTFYAALRRWFKNRYPEARALYQGNDSIPTLRDYIREE